MISFATIRARARWGQGAGGKLLTRVIVPWTGKTVVRRRVVQGVQGVQGSIEKGDRIRPPFAQRARAKGKGWTKTGKCCDRCSSINNTSKNYRGQPANGLDKDVGGQT